MNYQLVDKFRKSSLPKWFAPRNNHKLESVGTGYRRQLAGTNIVATCCVVGVAEWALQITASKPDENSSSPGKWALTLNCWENGM